MTCVLIQELEAEKHHISEELMRQQREASQLSAEKNSLSETMTNLSVTLQDVEEKMMNLIGDKATVERRW